MTPAGIEPATFRFVAKHLNHCITVQSAKYIQNMKPVKEDRQSNSPHRREREIHYRLGRTSATLTKSKEDSGNGLSEDCGIT